MYIGPWQEFKLAKILQLKDKLDKEAAEDNALPQANYPGAYGGEAGGRVKAHSTQGKGGAPMHTKGT